MGDGTVEDSLPIGVWDSLKTDAKGLRTEGRLAIETGRGQDVHALMKMGAIRGLSIGYRTRKAQYMPKGSTVKRRLLNVHLHEISLVVDPANSAAIIDSVRHADAGDRFMMALSRLGATLQ
jgi:hypothetical protein